jgi:hypothetical protein
VWYLSQCWGYRILLFGVQPHFGSASQILDTCREAVAAGSVPFEPLAAVIFRDLRRDLREAMLSYIIARQRPRLPCCTSNGPRRQKFLKENSLLSVSEAVRDVGAFGTLSKCGICRSVSALRSVATVQDARPPRGWAVYADADYLPLLLNSIKLLCCCCCQWLPNPHADTHGWTPRPRHVLRV